MRGIFVVIALLVAGVVALSVTRAFRDDGVGTAAATPQPSPSATTRRAGFTPVPNPYQHLDVISFTPEQLEALLAAGMEIQQGRVPSRTLSPEQIATFPQIERTLTAHVCPPKGSAESCERYRVDVPRCIDRAGEIVDWRRRERPRVNRKLFIAAMGVSVTGREFPTFVNLVRFCRDMIALDPAHAIPSPPQSPDGRRRR